MKFTLALLTAFSLWHSSIAQCGPEPSSGTNTIAANGILNSYYPGTLSPVSGATSIIVGTRDTRGGATVLAVNDLILIMQMQGADFNATNSDSYGDGVSGGAARGYLTTNLVAGYYEYANITAISGSTLTLQSGLVNNYYTRAFGASGIQAYQVIRIPRNYNLTINSGVTVSTPYWNGATGGVIVLDAVNVMTINGIITATGMGFRGGGGKQQAGAAGIGATDYRIPYATAPPAGSGGAKGEGFSGTPNYISNPATVVTTSLGVEGYLNGSAGWGAAANAGGGGSDGTPADNGHNTGGGGGANGGAGGKGGSGWHGGMGTVATHPTGGYGGAPFTQRSINRLVMGGGGGAGTCNNSDATTEYKVSGASGGGIVLLRAGSYTGTTGSITANGSAALGVTGSGGAGQSDAAGGGGAGGTIVTVTRTNVANGLSGVSASAIGGKGGNAEQYFEHGPGGGGGGGVIITNGAFSSALVTAGGSGLTRIATNTANVDNAYGSSAGATGATVTLATAPSILNGSFGASACGVLPVRLVSFTAAQTASATVLDWSVDLAVNFKGFEVQFSTDGADFIRLGDIAFNASQSKYQFIHSGSTSPVNYYRLKLNDKDGASSYSKTLVIRTNLATKSLVLYPQPAQGVTTVQVSALAKQKVNVQILSTSGSRVMQKQVQLAAGNNMFLIDNLGKLSAGVYTVRINIDGKMQTAKLMVE